MKVSFNPALETTSYVPAAVLAQSQCVTFTATVSAADYEAHIERGGVRIEVWSDIPVGGRREAGSWGSLSFERIEEARSTSLQEDCLPLIPLASLPRQQPPDDDVVLQARFVIPNSGQPCYSFTYRVAHPSGDFTWLGRYGHNSMLIPGGPAAVGWVPHTGWKYGSEEGTAIWGGQDGLVGRLSTDTTWNGWAVTEKGPIRFTTPESLTTRFTLIALFPNSVKGSLIFHLPIYMHTGARSTLSINPNLEITHHGQDTLQIHLLTNPLSLKALVDEHVRPFHGSIHPWDNPNFVAVSSYEHTDQSIHVLPVSPSRSTSTVVQLSSNILKDVENVVFCPTSQKAKKDPLSILIGRDGGEMMVAPAYRLEKDSGSWFISVLSPHATIKPITQFEEISPGPSEVALPTVMIPEDSPPANEKVMTPRMLEVTKSKTNISHPTFLLVLLRLVTLIFSILLQYLSVTSKTVPPPTSPSSTSTLLDHPKQSSDETTKTGTSEDDPPEYQEKRAIFGHLSKSLVFGNLRDPKIRLFLRSSPPGDLDDVTFHIGNQVTAAWAVKEIGNGEWLVELNRENDVGDILKVGLKI